MYFIVIATMCISTCALSIVVDLAIVYMLCQLYMYAHGHWKPCMIEHLYMYCFQFVYHIPENIGYGSQSSADCQPI